MQALQHSLAAGVEAFETDVCLTADGELVVLHDPLLSLTTTLSGWAHQRSAAAITAARLRDRDGQPTAEHPMLLGELLALIPSDRELQLEVKAHADPELAALTAEALSGRCRDQQARLEVISFHSSACATAARHGYRSRLIVWTDNSPEQMAAWALESGVGGFSVEHFLLSARLAEVFRGAGLTINTGTINDLELALRAIELAAPQAICTDRPIELAAELETALAASQPERAPVGVRTSG